MDIFLLMLQAFIINLFLSIDNAILIASVTKKLEKKERQWSEIIGASLATLFRLIFIILILFLLESFEIPFIYMLGGIFLMYIGLHLTNEKEKEVKEETKNIGLLKAIGLIIFVDLIMSLDNSIVVAESIVNMNIGPWWQIFVAILLLGITLPIIIFGADYLGTLMDRYKWIVYFAAILLVAVGIEMFLEDPLLNIDLNNWAMLLICYSSSIILVITKVYLWDKKITNN